MPIKRADLKAAIEQGVVVAQAAGLTSAEAAALRKVGDTAKNIHHNYNGCPMTLAGLYDVETDRHLTADTDGDGDSRSGAAFIRTYDRALASRPSTNLYGWATVID